MKSTELELAIGLRDTMKTIESFRQWLDINPDLGLTVITNGLMGKSLMFTNAKSSDLLNDMEDEVQQGLKSLGVEL